LLATVPPDLLVAWTRVVGHAGLRVRFDDPLGFAIHQLQQGQLPPPRTRLESWAQHHAPPAMPWTTADVARLNEHYGDLFRLGSGQAEPVGDAATVPARPGGDAPHVGPWTPAEVARVQQDYGDLFQVGAEGAPPWPPHRRPPPAGVPSERRDGATVYDETWADCGESAVGAAASGSAVLTALRLRAGRGALRTLLDQVRLVVQDGTVQVRCRDGAQMAHVHTHLLPLLPTVLAECGVQARVVVGILR
ncbi:MAG: hypothetical protein HC828_03945, partial [Blastochloris sp.]|nr:hypothetical protein [Blastochloris sp.]